MNKLILLKYIYKEILLIIPLNTITGYNIYFNICILLYFLFNNLNAGKNNTITKIDNSIVFIDSPVILPRL